MILIVANNKNMMDEKHFVGGDWRGMPGEWEWVRSICKLQVDHLEASPSARKASSFH